jgi:hypothetical protein
MTPQVSAALERLHDAIKAGPGHEPRCAMCDDSGWRAVQCTAGSLCGSRKCRQTHRAVTRCACRRPATQPVLFSEVPS